MEDHIPTLISGIRQIDADPSILLKNVIWERRWCSNPNVNKDEGTYYRCVENTETGEKCLQVVIFHNVQWFPYHPHDFSPIYFYFTEHNTLSRVLYDSYHHTVTSLSVLKLHKLRVIVFAPWRAFRLNETHWMQKPFKSNYILLTDDKLRAWWEYNDMRQFKLRSKFVNPWHPCLFPENVSGQATFRDEAPCPVCGEIVHLDFMKRRGSTIFCLDIRCRNRHTYTAIYDAANHQMETELK